MKKLTRTEYMRIGQSFASMWGGSCIDFEVDNEGNVEFDCIEHGDRFCVKQTDAECREELALISK